MDTGHWLYPLEFEISDYIGFIYKITLSDGRFYIGRKNFFTKKKLKPVKGKKRSRTSYKESDWKTYQSSSPVLKPLLSPPSAATKPHDVSYKILKLCTTKSEMSYYEVYFMIITNALTDPNGLNQNASRIPCRPKTTQNVPSDRFFRQVSLNSCDQTELNYAETYLPLS